MITLTSITGTVLLIEFMYSNTVRDTIINIIILFNIDSELVLPLLNVLITVQVIRINE